MFKNLLTPAIFFIFLFSGIQLWSQCPAITCPSNITVSNDAGNCNAMVNYTPPVGTNPCGGIQSMTFSYTGSVQTFTVPAAVTSVHVLAVGGGGGGANGHQGGGGSGFVSTGTYSVTPGQMISVTVGAGGTGAIVQINNNIVGLTAGGGSSFGALLTAAGGLIVTGINQTGNNGGSGGGGSCNAGSLGGAGGSGGGNGSGCTYAGGTGQGSYAASISTFTANAVTAGAGGAGGNSSHAGGGGAGGILIAGAGPSGGNGPQSFSPFGGQGYGAGGAAGGYDTSSPNRWEGGNGAAGVVYVEWTGSGPTSTSLSSGLASGSVFPLGANAIQYTATDGFGNTATCSFSVTVTDTSGPVITCPSNITATSTNSSCTSAVTFTAPTGTDNCTGSTTARTAGLASGTSFPVGITTETFTVTDSAGNTSNCSFTISITSNLTGTNTITICAGDSISVGTHFYSVAGTYVDTLQSSGGCDSIHTTQLTIAAPVNTGVSTTLTTITANLAGATYAWVDCNNGDSIITGQTAQSFSPLISGNYAVIITSAGCTDTSACSDFNVGTNSDISGKSISIYPNPAHEKITIDFGTITDQTMIEIIDLNGKILKAVDISQTKTYILDVQLLAKGMYVVKIKINQQEKNFRLIKE